MRNFTRGWFALGILSVAGCGPVIQTLSVGQGIAESFDGAMISYAFARGELSVTASYSKGILSISSDPQITAKADLNHQHTLVYQHGGLSIDEVDIQLDGAILKKVSSTTTDQSITALQAANTLLGQIATTQTTLGVAKPTTAKGLAPPATDQFGSDDIKVSRTADITYGKLKDPMVLQVSANCSIHLKMNVSAPVRTFGIAGYPRGVEICRQRTSAIKRFAFG
jgi:hypothetical protein